MHEPMMSAKQVAGLLGVSVYTVYRLAHKPDGLAAYKVAGTTRFKRDDVEAYIDGRKIRPPEKADSFVSGHFKYVPGMKVV